MPTVSEISLQQARLIIEIEEAHFSDVKAIDIRPAKLTQSVSAFANASGGDIYLGIDEQKNGDDKLRSWRGFADIEAANAHLQTVEALKPVGNFFQANFLRCAQLPGLILKLEVAKTTDIIYASDNHPYLRKGAGKIRIDTPDGLQRLKLDKGIISFEDEVVNSNPDDISNSRTIIAFLLNVIPTGEPDEWLRKQGLLVNGKPTVAGTLLFHDEPQAALPKRSGIKIIHYKTKASEGSRETLAGIPITIEGCIYDLINAAVSRTKSIIEQIKIHTERGFEAITYPHETLHEIITNAVLHRDYSIPSDIIISIFDNRIGIQSPGKLAGHVTTENILREQAARNGRIVRLINKFPDPPNKDVGEGLKTAFNAMKALKLKNPEIIEKILRYSSYSTCATCITSCRGHGIPKKPFRNYKQYRA